MPVAQELGALKIERHVSGLIEIVSATYGPYGHISASWGEPSRMGPMLQRIYPHMNSLSTFIAYIDNVEVERCHRRMGIGSGMVRAFKAFLRQNLVGLAFLMAHPEREEDMDALLRFYERLGFSLVAGFERIQDSPVMVVEL